jgi:hypothetical protein
MTAERHIDYETLGLEAMRGIVRAVLAHVAESGLPGQHHFYIAFNTRAPGVNISKRLRQKYPEEMTVVLQHRFWDLTVTQDCFEVKLTFDNVPERVVVPFSAIRVFFDPSAPYALHFEQIGLTAEAGPEHGPARIDESMRRNQSGTVDPGGREKRPRAQRKPRIEKDGDRAAQASTTGVKKALPRPRVVASREIDPVAANAPKVIDLDKFRKK